VSAATLIFIVLIFALLWLLFIRPQRRKQQAQQDLLNSVAPGDEVVTAGGLYGTVRAVQDDELRVEIAPGTEVRLAKRAVAAVIPPEVDEPDEAEEAYEIDEEEAEVVGEADVVDDGSREGSPDDVAKSDSAAETRR
jgi:preprotein translocase subunit YajC